MLNYFRCLLLNIRNEAQIPGLFKEEIPLTFQPVSYPFYIEQILMKLLGSSLSEKQLRATCFSLMIKDHPALQQIKNINNIDSSKRYFVGMTFNLASIFQEIKQSVFYLEFETECRKLEIEIPVENKLTVDFVNFLVALLLVLHKYYSSMRV